MQNKKIITIIHLYYLPKTLNNIMFIWLELK